jgi:hypothetical protein
MDQLSTQAMKLWPELAAQIGIAPVDVQVTPLARRQDARVDMVALRLDRQIGPALVLKLQAKPLDPEGFANAMQGHMQAFEAFPGGVPELLAVDFEAQACVMEFAEGQPLAVVLDGATLEQQASAMRRAGAWLGAYHRATYIETRVFQPKYTLGYLQDVTQEVRNGTREVVEPDRFLACAGTLHARKHLFEGRSTIAAQTHGDLHMRNLLMGPLVKAVDFSAERVVPVGHDIGRLLSDYAILRAPHDDIPPGEVLPILVRDAFFDGYCLIGPEDPSVQLLIRHRVLAEWWGLPADQQDRSVAQQRRWLGIESLAARVFPGR